MAWSVEEFPYPAVRFLVVSCDTELEKSTLSEKAIAKGWKFYMEGTDPIKNRLGIWFEKPQSATNPITKVS